MHLKYLGHQSYFDSRLFPATIKFAELENSVGQLQGIRKGEKPPYPAA
jgi:hypothetical protein